jgi:putative hydrolase of the HAD superfamily
MMERQWLTFDLDGTLMQNPFVGFVFPEIEETIRKHHGEALDVKRKLIEEHEQRMQKNEIVAAYDWDDIAQQLIQTLDLSVQIDIENLVRKHSTGEKVYVLEECIPSVLKRLKGQFKLAAVTNGYRRYQLPVLEALGLDVYFDAIITPDEAGYAKPDRDIFQPLLAEGSVRAHVGDRVDHDVCVAHRLGVPSIFICKKMPQEIKGLSPVARAKHQLGKQLVESKWCKESGQPTTTQTFTLYPDMIIHSIGELPLCLEMKE